MSDFFINKFLHTFFFFLLLSIRNDENSKEINYF